MIPDSVMELMDRLDKDTYNHSVRVSKLVEGANQYMHLSNEDMVSAAFLHDIGKLYIPPVILFKKGLLTNLERDLIDLHSYIGYELLGGFEQIPDSIRYMVLYHHSKNPACLHEVTNNLTTQIYDGAWKIKTMDVFDAICSDRPYHKGLSPNKAIEIMEYEGGYHPKCMEYLKEETAHGAV